MKKLILIIAFFYCLGFIKAQESDATLKETTDWLTGKINGLSFPCGREQINTNISFDGSICTYTMEKFNQNGVSYGKRIFVFNLKDISISSLNLVESSDCLPQTIILLTHNKAKLITYCNQPDDNCKIALKLDENISFERIKKAFTHAIKLSGGKEEKF
jgi:hypothetical protein